MDDRWSWAVCLGSFVLQCLAFGLHNNFGLLFNILLEKYGKTSAETAWVGALAFGITFLFSPFSSVVVKRAGYRISVTVCMASCMFALLISSFVDNIYVLYFTYSLYWGIGTSLANIASLVALPMFFDKYLSVATGLATSGSGVSSFALGPIMNYFLDHVGFRWTLRICSIMPLFCILALATFHMARKRSSRQVLQLSDDTLQTDLSDAVPPTYNSNSTNEVCKTRGSRSNDCSDNISRIIASGLPSSERDLNRRSLIKVNTSATPLPDHSTSEPFTFVENKDLEWEHLYVVKVDPYGTKSNSDTKGLLKPHGTKSNFDREGLLPNKMTSSTNSRAHSSHTSFVAMNIKTSGYKHAQDLNNNFHQVVPSTLSSTKPTPRSSRKSRRKLLTSSSWKREIFDRSLWTNSRYLLLVIGVSVFLFGYFIPFVHLNRLAMTHGASSTKASLLVGYLSIASTIGKVAFGFLINFQTIFHRSTLFVSSMAIMALSHLAIPSLTSYYSFTVYAVVFGLFDGCFVGQISTVLSDVVEDKSKIGVGLGNLFALFSIPVMSGPTVAGALYDLSNSYRVPFYVAGGVSLVGVFITSFIRICSCERREQRTMRQSRYYDASNDDHEMVDTSTVSSDVTPEKKLLMSAACSGRDEVIVSKVTVL